MKWSTKGFSFPTPVKIRKIATSILAACTFSGSCSLAMQWTKAAIIIFIAGFAAQFLSEYYKEDNNDGH